MDMRRTGRAVLRVLRRRAVSLLRHIDQANGEVIRRPTPHCYVWDASGDLVHNGNGETRPDPDGGGHKSRGRGTAPARARMGHAFLHHESR